MRFEPVKPPIRDQDSTGSQTDTKIVGFEVHDTSSAEHAAHLAKRTALAEGVHTEAARPVVH
jgi:hypothetical protein